ncbi:MAG: hypothetical protein RTU30_03225 [Candidatus Thorarchaeota archaeon]
MSENEIQQVVEQYIKKTRRKLPESFETEDLLEDLRVHIQESLSDKIQNRPSENPLLLLEEVLDEIGTPEEIAEEFGVATTKSDEIDGSKPRRDLVLRLFAAVIVVLIASAIASTVTGGQVDFLMSVVVLLFFAIAEWYLRAWQLSDAKKLDAKSKRRVV